MATPDRCERRAARRAQGCGMKITAVEAHVCNARMRNWVFVRVVTDEDGLYGWGEATLEWHTRAIVGAVEDLAELIVGEDPTQDRAPLADDVPPALLARQRHRPRHGDERHRHRALGHPRQGARRPVPQALGRAGARPRAALRPPRRGEDGGLLREQRAAAVRRARGRHGREGLHRVQVDGGAADDAARGARARPPRRALRRRDA